METIETEFDSHSLPKWAQRADTIALAKSSLAFRCDVYAAQHEQMQEYLTDVAERVQNYRENRRS